VETVELNSLERNLVPNDHGVTPSYWCTWAAQNYVYGQELDALDYSVLEGSQGAQLARNSLTEERLFGEKGWLKSFTPTYAVTFMSSWMTAGIYRWTWRNKPAVLVVYPYIVIGFLLLTVNRRNALPS
jgi:hypothetical protein